MTYRGFVLLAGSCLLALAMAITTFASGAGFIAAFLVYSLTGSFSLIACSAIAYFRVEMSGAGLVISEGGPASLGRA